jgi:hypothetical protein
MARYFVHLPPDGSPPIFWRSLAGFAGELSHINLNLLAHALGDAPVALAGSALVDTQHYFEFRRGGVGPIVIPDLQPFAVTLPDGSVQGLPIAGTNLERFLNDPLGGERMDLSLPFYDERIKLGTRGGGWFREVNAESAFHGGTDFNTDTDPEAVFEVCAAAEGNVHAMSGDTIVLTHRTPGGLEFRTVYVHMDLTSVPHILGGAVRRGERLGTLTDTDEDPQPIIDRPITNRFEEGLGPLGNHTPIHLHFGVAVQVRNGTPDLGGVAIDSFWYFIDPWGVYDFRDNNYLPRSGNIFESPIAGAEHTVQWRAQPVSKTIPIARRTDDYSEIVRVQVRARHSASLGGSLPAEHDQFLVWLKGDPGFFLVPLAQAVDQTTELELVNLLREAFFHGKSVRLEYRYEGDQRYIMAAWINA